ncbi:MAG: SMC family ATPase, partial [Synergistaceae bacterium]|nr:SMC family ATPase [Synergistaceae bacterium]
FEKYEVDPYKRDGQFDAWEQQIKADEAAIEQTDDMLAKYDEAARALAAQIAVSDSLSKAFIDLSSHRQALETHAAKQHDMVAVSERKQRGEIALRKVKPCAEKFDSANKAYQTASAELEKAKTAEKHAKLALEEAKKTLTELPPLDAAQEAFDKLRVEWEQTENKLKTLTAIKGDYDSIVGKNITLETLLAELAEIDKTISTLPPITAAQAALEKLKSELVKLSEKRDVLNGLKRDRDSITAKQSTLSAEQIEFETLTIQYKTAKTKYDGLYEIFLRGQAGVLAQSLENNEPCPVCGSTEHPAPAVLHDEDISESKLKKLNTEAERVKSKLDDKSSVCAILRAEITTLTERFSSDADKWFSEVPFDAIEALLVDTIEQAGKDISAMAIKKEADEKALSDLAIVSEAAVKRKEEITQQRTAIRVGIDTLTERFLKDFAPFSPEAIFETADADLTAAIGETKVRSVELTSEKNAKESDLARLKTKRERAAKAHTDSESKLSSAHTLVVERENRAKELSDISDTAKSEYQNALTVNGFTDEKSFSDALITEDVLAALTKELADYDESGKQLRRDITRLESETAGKEQPDLDKLKAERDEIKTNTDALRSERDETKTRLDNTSRVLKELKKSATALMKIEKEYAALKGLSDTANGKLDFETYAQMAYFERVLRAANMRLKVMSQNRYILLRREDSIDGRKRNGLEIEVADSYTGKSRSANSLSGGESFMASLSLALGLSDVVQQSTGGIHLDAMFIDEGFGSLDTEVLELSVRTLSDMTGSNRIVGIISHVAELRERIDKQVRVEKTTSGSKIRIVV